MMGDPSESDDFTEINDVGFPFSPLFWSPFSGSMPWVPVFSSAGT